MYIYIIAASLIIVTEILANGNNYYDIIGGVIKIFHRLYRQIKIRYIIICNFYNNNNSDARNDNNDDRNNIGNPNNTSNDNNNSTVYVSR